MSDEATPIAKESANRWTGFFIILFLNISIYFFFYLFLFLSDNMYTVRSYAKNTLQMENDTIVQMLSLPSELDYLP